MIEFIGIVSDLIIQVNYIGRRVDIKGVQAMRIHRFF